MNTTLFQLRSSGLSLLVLLGACSGGDINFPDWQPVVPPGPPGTIQFAEASYDVAEGAVANIFVVRSGGTSGVVSVAYATVDGGAEGGSDYTAGNGTLTWFSGTSGSQTISIPINDDNTAEGSESFTVTLSSVSRATLGARSTTTVNIIENDMAAVKAFGSITALDNATVNGIHYNTNGTNVSINGLPALVSDLKLGQVVSIEGEVNFGDATGRADEINYSASVIGPVESIDETLRQLIVLGQTVLTTADTVFETGIDPDTFEGLAIGANTQISGFRNADGDILAARIAFDTTSAGVQLIGTVAGLDLANMRFSVNQQIIDYGSALLIDLPLGMPTNGERVIVRGSFENGVLFVEEIAGISDLMAAPSVSG